MNLTPEQENEVRKAWNKLSYELDDKEWIGATQSYISFNPKPHRAYDFRLGYIAAKGWHKQEGE